MTRAAKLRSKLERNSISAFELRILMQNEGAVLIRCRGSHEVWKLNLRRFVLATHGKDLKPYQMKAAKEFLYGSQKEE